MTNNENKECQFCQGIATNLKQDVELISQDEAEDAEEISLLPISKSCNEEWYDGTESYPALLPL